MHYKRLLVRLLEPQGDPTQRERDELNIACVGMLERLKEVDPMRKARYEDLSASVVSPASGEGTCGVADEAAARRFEDLAGEEVKDG